MSRSRSMSTRNASRLVFTPGNEAGNKSGNAGHSNQPSLTVVGTNGSPSFGSGFTLS